MTTQKPKGKTPKCKWCGEWVDKSLNDYSKTNVGYYHNQCYEQFELNKQHMSELNSYISKIYNVEFPTGWMLKQIKEYKDNRKYTYKGMELTLRFICEVENKYLREASDSGLGLIPYYYEKAKQYYINLYSVTKSAESVEIENKAEIVYLKPPDNKKKNKLINIESL